MGSAFTSGICRLIAARGLPHGTVFDRISSWPEISDSSGDVVPLRLAASLHRLVLDASDKGLVDAYPPNSVSEDALHAAICAAVIEHDAFIADYLASAPQTNEVGRSSLLLVPLLQLEKRYNLPTTLVEIGASAGLNQNLKLYRYEYGDWSWGDPSSPVKLECEWRGARPSSISSQLTIEDTSGCDLAPIDVNQPQAQKRLLSYVWPDQTKRLKRLEGAIDIASRHKPSVYQSSAANWLGKVLTTPRQDRHIVIMHTIMWQYMPRQEQDRCKELVSGFGARATYRSPVTWLRFESDGNSKSGLLSATVWNGSDRNGQHTDLARGDFHGKWIEWRHNL